MLQAASSRTRDVNRLKLGLTAAEGGAGSLADGTKTLSSKARLLANGLNQISAQVVGLTPSIQSGQRQLRDAQARLVLLRIPIQTTQTELANAQAALDRAGAAGSDPAVQEAREDVSRAMAAVAGSSQQAAAAQAGTYRGL